jgi:hypothetical protein
MAYPQIYKGELTFQNSQQYQEALDNAEAYLKVVQTNIALADLIDASQMDGQPTLHINRKVYAAASSYDELVVTLHMLAAKATDGLVEASIEAGGNLQTAWIRPATGTR